MPKTINQTYQNAYKSKRRRRAAVVLSILLAIIVSVFGGIYYAFFLSEWLAVREVAIEQKSFVSSEEIKKITESYLREKSWFVSRARSLLLVDEETIQSMLARKFPVLKNITVEKKYFHSLIINTDYREVMGIWCFQKQGSCLYFDEDGIAFDRATDSSGTLFLIVHDYLKDAKDLGQKVTDAEGFDPVLQLKKELDRAKIGVSRIIIPEELYRINVKTTEGWEIYFNTNDPLIPQIKALTIFLANKLSFEQRSRLQYVDVRIPQRVYYKMTNNLPTE